MSVIQNIRDKYARIAVIAIALALLGFIAMDAFTGRSNPFGGGGPSNSVGKVNGTNIKYDEFNSFVTQTEDNYKRQGYPPALARQQAMDQVWNMEVTKILLEEEFDKLGIAVSDKELSVDLLGPESKQLLQQVFPEFVDQQTGDIDLVMLAQQINNIRKKGSAQDKQVISERLDRLIINRQNDKYGSLLINGNANVPKWLVEKQAAERSQIARVSFVRKPYTEVSDSLVKISDDEIQDYINKHKNDFKQTESRSIAYVTFPVVASSSDSATLKASLEKKKADFEKAPDADAYVAQSSLTPQPSVFQSQANLPASVKDTLKSLAIGGVFGPYVDGGSYQLARMIDKKNLPDSVKCRHILIPVQQGENDSTAKVRIDSIGRAIKGGASWEAMAKQYNPDGTRDTKGEMTFSADQIMAPNFAPEFAQFILFDGKPGEEKAVKTQYGWHYIGIMNWMGMQPYYKIAYLSTSIDASKETISEARNKAATFSGEARDEKAFNEKIDTKWRALGFDKNVATRIAPTAASFGNFMDAREFVKAVYQAKRGVVMQPESVGSDFVVAVVTGIYEEGTESPAVARPKVEQLLKTKKKGEIIAKELGAISTLDAVAAKWGKPIEVADSIGVMGSGNGSLGYEPKVIGAAFNAANRGKVVTTALPGINGVYVIRVEDVSAVPSTAGSIDDQRKQALEEAKQRAGNPLEGLHNAATIKDNRAKHY
ncbi:MAG TPA: peptidylprolyl isomerase [Chitinophagaceae bacterium]|nr:peptidylprolyl isomerase [Chitinophagaceae bacterium]